MMSGVEEDQEENPAEPVPDVATVAEPPQPPEPIAEEEEEAEGEANTAKSPASSSTEDVEPIDAPRVPGNDASKDIAGGIIPQNEREEKFTQTFVKYTKNLPDKRLVEIINTVIDHEDKTLVFYCTSEELLRSFEEGFTPGIS